MEGVIRIKQEYDLTIPTPLPKVELEDRVHSLFMPHVSLAG